MSLNPHLGHLYHDGNISNVYTALDVQDNLRTREINARETKYLDKYAQVLDRAKSVCRRRNEWEQTCLRKQLKNIETKTPSLAKSLRLESERLKTCRKDCSNLPDILGNQTANKGNHHMEQQGRIYVSSWSVYSNSITRNRSAPSSSRAYDDREHIWDKTDIYDVNTALKKAERVTKTLHRLYTQTVKRKLKENQMTVLDVLGKDSKEELEKALFVLRGSPAGEVIENILKEKEFVSKKRLQSHLIAPDKSDSSEITGDVFITRITSDVTKSDSYSDETKGLIKSNYVENDKDHFFTRNDCSETSFRHPVSTHALPDVFDNSKKNTLASVSSTSNKSASSGNLNSPEATLSPISLPQNRVSDLLSINDVFRRDEALVMSSTLANASDIDTAPIQVRWTDLFKTPELWKQNKYANSKKVKIEKNLSLVTLTGKRRQTMLKR